MARNEPPASSTDHAGSPLDATRLGRRDLLQLGGLTVAAGALLAACGDEGELGRVGLAAPTTALPDPVVDDVVYLRTASSMEHSIAGVYDRILDDVLLAPDNIEAAQRFRADHEAHADTFQQLTRLIDGEEWDAPNPRIEATVVTPAFAAIEGAPPATPEGTATPKSDDPLRDVLNLIHALETISAQTYQMMMTQLSGPSLRAQVIEIATHAARRSAALAIAITGRPEGYLDPSDLPGSVAPPSTAATTTTVQDIAGRATTTTEPEAPPTPIPAVYAITTQFGGLAALALVIGAPNEAGTRTTITLDTPSLNTFVYEYMEPPTG